MRKKFKGLVTLLLAAAMLILAACSSGTTSGEEKGGESSGGDFPSKPVKIVVPWGSGGNADVFARQAAALGKKYLGQEMIVENRTGAGGEIALTDFAKTQPDAHTILITSATNFTLTPKVKQVAYQLEDYQPLMGNFYVEFILMTNPSKTGIETMDDLVEYAKTHKIKFGATGSLQTDTNLVQAALFKQLGIDAEPVIFDGGMELTNNLLGGHVDVTVGVAPIMNDFLKSGELKALGTFAPFPYEVEGMDPIPPLSEQGYDVSFVGFNYFNVSPDTPKDVVDKLYKVFEEIYEDPQFKDYVEANKIRMNPAGSEEISTFLDEQSAEIDKLLEAAQK